MTAQQTMPRDIEIPSAHGARLRARLFETDRAPLASIVLAPALGVARRYYEPFAAFAASKGFRTITFSYRGMEDSTLGELSGKQTKLQHWGQYDIDAVIAHALAGASAPVFLMGHSCGGQVWGFAANARHLAGAVFVASQSGYWRNWSGLDQFGMGVLFHAVFPLLSMGEYFRAKRLRVFPLDVPSGVIQQWAQWGRRPGYLFDLANGIDAQHYHYDKFSGPILAYSFSDDRYAPPRSVSALLKNLPNSAVEHCSPAPKDYGGKIGHFGFFQPRFQDNLWADTVAWMRLRF